VIFDESNDGMLTGSIVQNLNLNKYSNNEEEAPKEVDLVNEHPQEDTPSQI